MVERFLPDVGRPPMLPKLRPLAPPRRLPQRDHNFVLSGRFDVKMRRSSFLERGALESFPSSHSAISNCASALGVEYSMASSCSPSSPASKNSSITVSRRSMSKSSSVSAWASRWACPAQTKDCRGSNSPATLPCRLM